MTDQDTATAEKPQAPAASPEATTAAADQTPKVHPNRAAFDLLAEQYPDLFNLRAPKPLQINIHVSLAEDGKFSKTKIRRALNFYVQQYSYIKSVAAGGARFGLQGEAGEVKPEDAEHAKTRVAEIEERRKAKRDARRKTEQAARPKAKKSRPMNAEGKPNHAKRKADKPSTPQAPKSNAEKPTEPAAPETPAEKEARLNEKLASLANRFAKH
ncbi:ProQ/FINO family protein [Salinispirillum marinum]|uniref:ProQ/FINO family protein n=2 Tax=Saccharospirillaceae TaxID=255527 RepID=A0ABV8BD67_9GAMM